MNLITVRAFDEQLPQMQAVLRELVEIESPSTDKAALDRMGAKLTQLLRPLEPEIEIDAQPVAGDNIVARWPGSNGRVEGGFLILCHFDTVHPLGMLAENPVRVQAGEIYGPGTIDMKASIVQMLFALQTLRAEQRWPQWPLTLLLTSDEEVGSEGARPLIESLGRRAELVLCMEPALPGGALKTARKGVANFEVVTRGQAAHSGADHRSGVNAIEEMAHQVLMLQALTDYEVGSTVSVGKITGGTRSNVVPDECRLIVDLRVTTQAEAERMTALIEGLQTNLPGAQLHVTGSLERAPMPRTEAIAAAYHRACEIGAALGITISEGSTGGGSDANLIAPFGVPILDGLGPQGNGAHTRNESLTLASLAPRTALLAGILSEWPHD